MNNRLLNGVINVAMLINRYRVKGPLLRAARQPAKTQAALLQSILTENVDTEIGKKYGFGTINSLTEFQQRVPIHEFDDLETLIERQIDGEKVLTRQTPVYYARTSGTTGRFKNIPLTQPGLKQVQTAQKQLAVSLWQDTNFFAGKVMGFAGAAVEGELRNGISYGSVSGTTYRSLSRIIASKFAVPAEALSLSDVEAKYQVYGLTVLGCNNLTGIVTANPSSILKLVQFIDVHLEEFLRVVNGEDTAWLREEAVKLLPDVLRKVHSQRVTTLQTHFRKNGTLSPEMLFPQLSTIATWTGGSCGTAIRQLKPYLPQQVRFVEFGYGASEFMGSVNVNAVENACLPQLTQHVYEFVERELWEQKQTRFIGVEDLVQGKDYYIFVTTQSGLYRYHINDIIRVGATIENCPTVYFLQKGKGVTNITGEKLSEFQLIASLEEAIAESDFAIGGYIALANVEKSRYDLYIETVPTEQCNSLARLIDEKLRKANAEYDDKRNSGRLRAATVLPLLSNACEQMKQWSLERGVREVQYKPTLLDYADAWEQRLVGLLAQTDEL